MTRCLENYTANSFSPFTNLKLQPTSEIDRRVMVVIYPITWPKTVFSIRLPQPTIFAKGATMPRPGPSQYGKKQVCTAHVPYTESLVTIVFYCFPLFLGAQVQCTEI